MLENNYGQHQSPPRSENWMEPIPEMGFMEAVKVSFEKYADFEGRARRTEFWYFRLFQIIVVLGLAFLCVPLAVIEERLIVLPIILIIIFAIGTILPSLASSVRRLHDTGNSGWLILLDIFCTNGLVMIVMGCIEGKIGPNQYGPDPKRPNTDFHNRNRFY
ncbi:MAG: DUF805 domain-containing protein [Nonlabens sp.]|uniref:DUF805 domain-containing protein n=1 Tax=Nonlabens sp. TaxID=1888209 RepID=UPI003EF3FE74